MSLVRKMFGGFRRTLVLLVFASSLITSTLGYKCDQYCNKKCEGSIPDPSFTDCLDAHVYCDCGKKDSGSSSNMTWLWVALVTGAMIVFGGLIGCCCGKKRRCCTSSSRPRPSFLVAEPVVSTIGDSNYNDIITIDRDFAPRAPPSALVQIPQEPPTDICQEYLPPPSYYDVVNINDSVNTSDQTNANEYKYNKY